MPVQHNGGGTAEERIPYVNQGGSAIECNVYVNEGGTAVPIHSVGIDRTYPSVMEDFESYADTADLRSSWDAPNPDRLDLETTNPLEGSQSADSNAPTLRVGNGDITTFDGEVWSIDVVLTETVNWIGLFINNQNLGSLFNNTVYGRFDFGNGEIGCWTFDGGSTADMTTTALSESVTAGTRYRLAVQPDDAGGLTRAWVDDVDSGTEIGSVTCAYNTSWSDGVPAFDIERAADVEAVDELQVWEDRASMTFPGSVTVFDDFERASLDHYAGNTGDWTIDSTHAFNGNNALRCTSNNPIWSDGSLSDTPTQGEPFRAYVLWESQDDFHGARFGWASTQDADNYYGVQLQDRPGGTLARLYTTDGGSESTIEDTTGVTFDTGNFHEIQVDWANDDSISVEVIGDGGDGSTIASLSGTGTISNPGTGLFFDSDGSSADDWWDYLHEP